MSSYLVSIIMFVVYVGILGLLIIRTSLSKTFFSKVVPAGISFGMLSYVVLQALNSLELPFMDTQGIIHVIFVGPFQEEVVKFAFFLLALRFATGLSARKKPSQADFDLKTSVLLGGLLGLALAFLENLIDYGYLTATNTLLRTLLSWPFHILPAMLSALGFRKFQATDRISILLVPLSSAILIHAVYNTLLFFT